MPDTPPAPPTRHSVASLDALYAAPPPWDIGRPQPALLDLADRGMLGGGPVLDVGCGTGEHTLMAAELGLAATGVDLAAPALAAAERKAAARGLTARFLRHDVRDLAALGESFATVLDSLVLHTFHGANRARYVAALHAVTAPGGHCFVLSFRDEPPGPPGRVHRMTPQEIRTAFTAGWRVHTIEPAPITTTLPPPYTTLPAWRTHLTRL